ncbi:hypothetical protein T265_05720 [Opisthorchis viverrini]|uniref:Uncharacterized protein n=1 Tax=Opisthorchis viverrini TaxID=6198 RepID=A0A074ZJN4_OPIVI|nr:hypothetical protein T265_05720 [Opisthorchis viverrini]KER27186.1 hypothetical protein T265_05720 [Opisthorchis viverrini]
MSPQTLTKRLQIRCQARRTHQQPPDQSPHMFNTDPPLPYNHDLFESIIVKKRIKVDGGGNYRNFPWLAFDRSYRAHHHQRQHDISAQHQCFTAVQP